MTRRLLLTVIAASAWIALILQYYLMVTTNQIRLANTIVNFFSYFTILTNLLVAVVSTRLLLGAELTQKRIAAVAVYITIVGAVYNLILRSLWDPQGLQKVVDELLHSVNPLLFVIFWVLCVGKDELKWRDAFNWLIYPIGYSVYTLIHGAISNWYPYPFINPNKIGWDRVAINSVFVLIAFLAVSFVAISIGQLRNRTAKV